MLLKPYVPSITIPETGQLKKETNHLCKETLRVIHCSINKKINWVNVNEIEHRRLRTRSYSVLVILAKGKCRGLRTKKE